MRLFIIAILVYLLHQTNTAREDLIKEHTILQGELVLTKETLKDTQECKPKVRIVEVPTVKVEYVNTQPSQKEPIPKPDEDSWSGTGY